MPSGSDVYVVSGIVSGSDLVLTNSDGSTVTIPVSGIGALATTIYNSDGTIAGARVVDMNGNTVTFTNGGPFIIDGKLTVTGLIDPTGMQFSGPQPDATMPTETIYITDGSSSGHPVGTFVYKDSGGSYHAMTDAIVAASGVGYDNSGSGLVATTTQGAIDELALAVTGMAHTTITNIDLKSTGNPNEYVVEITWIDADGVTHVTSDPTPVIVSGEEPAYSRASQVSNQTVTVSGTFANAGTQLVVTVPSAGTWWIRYKATFSMTHIGDGPQFSLSTIASGTVTGNVVATRDYYLKQTGQGGDLDDNSVISVRGSARVTTTGSEQFRVLVASTNWNSLTLLAAAGGFGESFIEYERAL